MPALAEDLVGLVETVVSPLVEYKEDLQIDSFEGEDGNILIEIRVNPDDAGKVIGRQGRIIKAIRTLTRAAATRSDASVDVELVD